MKEVPTYRQASKCWRNNTRHHNQPRSVFASYPQKQIPPHGLWNTETRAQSRATVFRNTNQRLGETLRKGLSFLSAAGGPQWAHDPRHQASCKSRNEAALKCSKYCFPEACVACKLVKMPWTGLDPLGPPYCQTSLLRVMYIYINVGAVDMHAPTAAAVEHANRIFFRENLLQPVLLHSEGFNFANC